MKITRFVVRLFSVGMTLLGASGACGQDYPTKLIRIVTSGVGGGSDFTARLIAKELTGNLGQQVIVENRASGSLSGETVAQAPPDGYTLILVGGTFLIEPLLQKTPYDPVKDFSPITLVSKEPSILVVHPSVLAKSVKDVIALAKATPGALNYASGVTGSSAHLAAELFKSMAGINIVRVPYKAMGPALNDLIGGQVQLMVGSAPSVTPHVKAGRLRALAVTTAQPSALTPDLPTVAASVPGYEWVGTTGILAPARTPESIIKRLNQEIVRVLHQTDVKQKFLDIGQEVVGSSPEQHATTMKSEMASVGKVIKDAGITAN